MGAVITSSQTSKEKSTPNKPPAYACMLLTYYHAVLDYLCTQLLQLFGLAAPSVLLTNMKSNVMLCWAHVEGTSHRLPHRAGSGLLEGYALGACAKQLKLPAASLKSSKSGKSSALGPDSPESRTPLKTITQVRQDARQLTSLGCKGFAVPKKTDNKANVTATTTQAC